MKCATVLARHTWLNHAPEERLATEKIGTLYQRVADGIRGKIISGEYPVGSTIPSTRQLEKQYGVSQSAVRQGVSELKTAGILVGQPGKAVYVKAVPAAASAEKHDIETLSKRVTELEQRAEEDRDLRDKVEDLKASIIELYGKNGLTYQDRDTSGPKALDRRARHG